MELIKTVLQKLKDDLKNDEIFLSEADFQFSFAKKLYELNIQKKLSEDSKEVNPYKSKIDNIILEYPIMTKDLYKDNVECQKFIKNSYKNGKRCKGCDKWAKNYCEKFDNPNPKCNYKRLDTRFNEDRTFIDLAFTYDNTQYFVEFKYKTDKLKNVIRHIENNKFDLKKQSAENIGRYLVYEDIERMENIKKVKENCNSFVIFLTNSSKYWDNSPKEDSTDSDFTLQKDVSIITAGEHKWKNKTGDNKNYKRPIYLEKMYKFNGWYKFKPAENEDISYSISQFKCLIIQVGKNN